MNYLSLLPEAKTFLELRNQQANVITTYYMGLSMSLYYVRITAKINLEILELQREIYMGFPAGASGKELTCQRRRCRRRRFNPWVRKIPWRRAWQPTPVFLPGESHGQRGLVGYSPRGQGVGHDWSDWARRDTQREHLFFSLLSLWHWGPAMWKIFPKFLYYNR